MPLRRARLGLTNALAWAATGLASTALASDALTRDGGSLTLALGTAAAIAGAALGLLTPHAVATRTRLLVAGSLALLACAAAGALTLLQQPQHLAIAAALGIAAGMHAAAIRAAATADATLAPRVRPAPSLLAAAVGASLTAAAGLLPADGTGVALIVAAVLQLIVLSLAAGAVTTAAASGLGTASQPATAARSGTASEPGTAQAAAARPDAAAPVDRAAAEDPRLSPEPRDPDARRAGTVTPHRAPIAPPALLALLAIAAAGVGALVALRPGLSAIGADDPAPAAPIAITLAIGALLGPPLAMLADRVGAAGAATLAVIGGGAALIAPIARPGVLDVIVAVVLGIALAAAVALAELARRAEQRLAAGATAMLVLAGAAGAGIAGLLLSAVPVPDVVLGAAMTCLVAGVGMWAPGVGVRQRIS